jgi:acyl-CoA synthetase (AMP-forming)/AMP-acid ligase II
VVLDPGRNLTPKDIQLACQARLEPHMVPTVVEFLDELPKTTSLKTKKQDLR